MNWYGPGCAGRHAGEAIALLNAALVRIMAKPDVRQRLEGAGMEATTSSPEQFQQLMAGERAKWSALIRKVGMEAQ